MKQRILKIVSVILALSIFIPSLYLSSAISSPVPPPSPSVACSRAAESRGVDDAWGYRVVFDRSHAQMHSPYDVGFCGYSQYAVLMQENGFRVEQSTLPLLQTLSGLTDRDILFLGLSMIPYNDTEIAAIRDYISGGGNAIVIGEHENVLGMPGYQNALIKDMGAEFRDDAVVERKEGRYFFGPENAGALDGGSVWLLAEGAGPLAGMEEVPLYSVCSINTSENATPILLASEEASPSNAVVSALLNYGDGHVICVSDSEVFWNGDGLISIDYANASLFSMSILDLLVTRENITATFDYDLVTGDCNVTAVFSAPVLSDTIDFEVVGGVFVETPKLVSPTLKVSLQLTVFEDGYLDVILNGTPIKRLYFLKSSSGDSPVFSSLIVEAGHSRGATAAPDSLLGMAMVMRDSGMSVFASSENSSSLGRDFDSYVVVNPLTTLNFRGERGRNLLVATDFFTTLIYEKPWSTLIRAGYKTPAIPVAPLFERYNVSFSNKLIVRADYYENPFYVRGEHDFGFDFPMFDAVAISGNSSSRQLARSENGGWADYYDLFAPAITHDSEDSNDTSVLLYVEDAMLFGGAESLTNQFLADSGTSYLLKSVADWLAFGYSQRGGRVEILTSPRGEVVTLSGDSSPVPVEAGRASFSIPSRSGFTLGIAVTYTYGDNVSGSYYREVPVQSPFPALYLLIGAVILLVSVVSFLWVRKRKLVSR